jgi:glycogen debranching enzyme
MSTGISMTASAPQAWAVAYFVLRAYQSLTDERQYASRFFLKKRPSKKCLKKNRIKYLK